MGTPDARWTGVRQVKCCRDRDDRMEWWVDVTVKLILVGQMFPTCIWATLG